MDFNKMGKIKFGFLILFLSLTILFSIFFVLPISAEESPEHKYVCAHYYPWYNSSEDPWNSSLDIPKIGPYDSWNENVINYHLAKMDSAGIDCVISSWWGWGWWRWNLMDSNYQILFNLTEQYNAEHNTSIKLSVSFEQTLNESQVANESGTLVNFTANQFEDLLDRDANRSEFLRIENRPVIFIYRTALWSELNSTQWEEIIEQMNDDGYYPYFIADVAHVQDHWWREGEKEPGEIFDGIYIYNPIESSIIDDNYPDFWGNYSAMVNWYKKLRQYADNYNISYAATAMPGFNKTHLGVAWNFSYPRYNGLTYNQSWMASIESDPDMMLITTFNEWYETTMIEPSVIYNGTYLGLTKTWAQNFTGA